MDRAQQQAVASSLMFREGETVAEILQAYHALVLIATDRITNKASIGHAAHNSMAMQLETQRLASAFDAPIWRFQLTLAFQIKGVENLLALTRRIRELWIVGPLRQLEGGRDLEEKIASEVQSVVNIMNQMRSNTRQQYVSAGGGYGQYVEGPLTAPVNAPTHGSANVPPNGQSNGPAAPAP